MINKYDLIILDADGTIFDYYGDQRRIIDEALGLPQNSNGYEIVFEYGQKRSEFIDAFEYLTLRQRASKRNRRIIRTS